MDLQPALDTTETTADSKKVCWILEKAIRAGLGDAERRGSPVKFSAAAADRLEHCQILGVALKEPRKSGRPVNHSGLAELTDEVIKRGIVLRIIRSQVGSFLKKDSARSNSTRPKAGSTLSVRPRS